MKDIWIESDCDLSSSTIQNENNRYRPIFNVSITFYHRLYVFSEKTGTPMNIKNALNNEYMDQNTANEYISRYNTTRKVQCIFSTKIKDYPASIETLDVAYFDVKVDSFVKDLQSDTIFILNQFAMICTSFLALFTLISIIFLVVPVLVNLKYGNPNTW